jgi:hypothetical protein
LVKNGLDFIKIVDHHIFKRKLISCYEDLDNSESDFVDYVLKTSKFIRINVIHDQVQISKYISVGTMVGNKVYNSLNEIALSSKTTIGKMLKKYLIEISSGIVTNFHLTKKDNSISEIHNSNK